MEDRQQYNILFSCTGEKQRGHEAFVAEHALCYMISGAIDLYTPKGVLTFAAGALGFARRNQLVNTIKRPAADASFLCINIFLDQATLRRYSNEKDIHATETHPGETLIHIPEDPFIKGYFDSLLPYFNQPDKLTESLAALKTTEAIELLLRDAAMKNILFDFSEPHKIDIEGFMNRHFMYNVPMSQFAKLTGRSLASFKRDFRKVFELPPERWLHQKRLEQAHYLLSKKKLSPSEVYLEVGFTNLSHFSTAFKTFYGQTPSSV